MIGIVGIVFPVFALILIGWAAGRRGLLPENAVDVLNGFVVRLALPVLLFQFVAEADWAALWQPDFVAALGLGIVTLFALAFLFAGRQPIAERSITALAAAYANTAFMGIPIGRALFGEEGMAAAVIASLLTVCAIFAVGILLVEIDLHRSKGALRAARGVAISVMLNPLVFGPVAGALWALGGLGLPGPLHDLASLLGTTASPVALVTIGLFLSRPAPPSAAPPAAVATLVLVKLVGHPLLTLGFVRVIGVPQPWGALAVLIAAMPTGTGPFMLAKLYDRDAALTGRVILISTLLSAATIPLLAALLIG